ncbi:hypothetical protein [Burkholderia sp. Bp9099]|uniref:hypothetical protein n=1 Tax=Burkholderia sp. Bp9099 TaxID=2184568 RepID=UPI000F5DA7D6|nr:hypothetical protein [Burkholderia sp. Bp9099]RQZ50903.1 hypothetical protein DIE17_03765 [Burkholderia sp. Bp9099]
MDRQQRETSDTLFDAISEDAQMWMTRAERRQMARRIECFEITRDDAIAELNRIGRDMACQRA